MRRSTLGLLAILPIVLIVSFQFMDYSIKQDWGRTRDSALLLFFTFPIFTFLFLRFVKNTALVYLTLNAFLSVVFGGLAIFTTLTIGIDYDHQAPIPAVIIFQIIALTTLSGWVYGLLLKWLFSWKATKAIFCIVYPGCLLLIFSMFWMYYNTMGQLLFTFSIAMAFIIDLFLEMRIAFGRGPAISAAQCGIAGILLFIIMAPLLYVIFIPFGASI